MRDIESQSLAQETTKRKGKQFRILISIPLAIAVGLLFVVVMYFQHQPIQLTNQRDLLGRRGETFNFPSYIESMKAFFPHFEFLPHGVEASWEAMWYKEHGKIQFEGKYDYPKPGSSYTVISVGSSSTQAFVVKGDQVTTLKIMGDSTFGATKAMEQSQVTEFVKHLIQASDDSDADMSQHPFIFATSIGYGANEIKKNKGEGSVKDPGPLFYELLKIGVGEVITMDDSWGDAAKNVQKLHVAALEQGRKWFVKPRIDPKIDNSWAKYRLKMLPGEKVVPAGGKVVPAGGKVVAIADVGGGPSKYVYYKKEQSESVNAGECKTFKVNDLFKAAVQSSETGKEAKLASQVAGLINKALADLNQKIGETLPVTSDKVMVYQTGEMRKQYFEWFFASGF